MLNEKSWFFSIGGGTETMVICQTIQTRYSDSSAISDGVDKLAGIQTMSHECKQFMPQRLTDFLPIPKVGTKLYIFLMRMKKNCLKNDVGLGSLLSGRESHSGGLYTHNLIIS